MDEALLLGNNWLTYKYVFKWSSKKRNWDEVGRYKQWLGMMTKAYPQAKELWDQVKRIKALDEIVQQLEQTGSSRI